MKASWSEARVSVCIRVYRCVYQQSLSEYMYLVLYSVCIVQVYQNAIHVSNWVREYKWIATRILVRIRAYRDVLAYADRIHCRYTLNTSKYMYREQTPPLQRANPTYPEAVECKEVQVR